MIGVFVCMYGYCLAADSHFNLSQEDMPNIRNIIMILELMSKILIFIKLEYYVRLHVC